MSSTGTTTSIVELLAHAGVDDGDRPRPAVVVEAAEEAGDLVERALGGRQADALRRGLPAPVTSCSSRSRVSDRWAPRLVAATAWISSTITASTPRSVSRAWRGEHQVERLGRGDEDVGRVAQRAGGARRPRCRRCGCRPSGSWTATPEPLGGQADAGERRPQVLLDVDGEGPQRRDVEDPGAGVAVGGRRLGHQAVDAPQEGGEGLARAGGGQDQRVAPAGDGRPALGLGRRGLAEGGARTTARTGSENARTSRATSEPTGET